VATNPLAGQIIRTEDAFELQSFTPTYTNLTLGTGNSNEGWYQMIGQFVLWGFRTELGTGGTATTTVTMDLPVDAYSGGGVSLQGALGSWIFRDSSAGDHYSGSIGIFQAAGDVCSFAGAWAAAGTISPRTRLFTASSPVVPAIGDVISGTGCYRAL
jgi:hypothetical protein